MDEEKYALIRFALLIVFLLVVYLIGESFVSGVLSVSELPSLDVIYNPRVVSFFYGFVTAFAVSRLTRSDG